MRLSKNRAFLGDKNERVKMERFGKKMPKQVRQGLVKIAFLIVGILAALSMPFIATFGWLSFNQSVLDNGLQISARGEKYDILIDRRAEVFDEDELNMENKPLYPHISDFRDKLEAEMYDFSYDSTEDSPRLAFELTNEYHDINGGYNLLPGSYGTLEFYLRPHSGYDNTTVEISFDLLGYYYDIDTSSVLPITDSKTAGILKGHLLFFTNRSGNEYSEYVYSGLICDGGFSYTMNPANKCTTPGRTDCYKITLYWQWPITYEEIAEETSTVSPAVTKKYPAELRTYVSAHPEYFFDANVTNVESETLMFLNDGYDNADQRIGDSVNFVLIKIK